MQRRKVLAKGRAAYDVQREACDWRADVLDERLARVIDRVLLDLALPNGSQIPRNGEEGRHERMDGRGREGGRHDAALADMVVALAA